MSRANTDLQQIQAFVVMIPLTISNGVTVLAVTVILFLIDPVLTLLALGSLPFLNVLATRFSRRLHPAVMGIQQESAELAAVVEETVAGVRVVKGFGAEPVQAARLARRGRRRVTAARWRPPACGPRSSRRSSCSPTSASSPRSATAATRCSTATSRLGELVGVQRLRRDADLAAADARHDHRPGPAVGRRPPSGSTRSSRPRPVIVDRPTAQPLPAAGPDGGRGEVRFEGVRFAYAPELPVVLDGLDLDRPGRPVGRPRRRHRLGQDHRRPAHPALLRRAVAARCRVDGVDVRDVRAPRAAQGRRHRVRGHVPVLRQHRAPTSPSPTPTPPTEAIERAARLAGAHEFIDELPEGYDTLDRRARLLAVGRPAAAHRHRPGDPRRPPGADPRRRHLVGRPHQGARDPRRARRGDARPHHDRHRPPAGHHRPRRPGRAARRRPRRRRRHPRRAARARAPRTARCSPRPSAERPRRDARREEVD